MITPQLLDYIKNQLSLGKGKEEIKAVLAQQGWALADLEEAFRISGVPQTPLEQPQAPPLQPSQTPLGQSWTGGASQPMADIDLTDEETDKIYSSGSAKKPLGRKIIPIIATILGIALIGGGAAAYFFYFQSPERIMAKMRGKSLKVQSNRFSGQAGIEVGVEGLDNLGGLVPGAQTQGQASGFPISAKINFATMLQFEGGQDSKNPDEEQFFLNLKLVNADDVLEKRTPFIGAEMMSMGKLFYFRLTELAELAASREDFAKFKDKWIKIDSDSLKSQLEQMGMGEQLKEIEEFEKTQESAKGKEEEIGRLWQDPKLIKITGKLKGEKIDNERTFHYQYLIDKEILRKIISEQNKIITGKEPEQWQKEAEEMMFAGLSSPEGEIWIGKKTLLVRKLTLKSGLAVEKYGIKVSVKIDFLINNKDFNMPLALQPPAEAMPLEEFFQNMAGSLGGQLLPKDCSVKTGEEKDLCYFDSAKLSLSDSDCGKIVSLTKRYDCYTKVAEGKKDSSFCQKIAGSGSQGWRDECYRAVAEKTGDSSLCEKIIIVNWKNYCLGVALKDASYCQKIKRADARQACETKVGAE